MGNSGSTSNDRNNNNNLNRNATGFRASMTAQLAEISRMFLPDANRRGSASGDAGDHQSNPGASASLQNAPTREPLTRPRYSLRRTSARLRRSNNPSDVEASRAASETNTPLGENSLNLPENSLNIPDDFEANATDSEAGRRRPRRPSFDNGSESTQAQRPRLLSDVMGRITGEDTEQDNPSLFFFFPLQDAATPRPAQQNAPSVPRVNVPVTSVEQLEELRRSFIRTPNSDAASTGQASEQRLSPQPQNLSPQVFVRVRQSEVRNQQDPGLQWTLYFLMPTTGSPAESADISSLPVDPQMVLLQAFAAFNNLLVNDELSFEQLTRLQEMMGVVNRGVTLDQINSKLANFPFKNAETSGISGCPCGSSCAICLNEYVLDESLRTLPCKHSYHTECIDKWLTEVNKCPLCRQEPIQRDSQRSPAQGA